MRMGPPWRVIEDARLEVRGQARTLRRSCSARSLTERRPEHGCGSSGTRLRIAGAHFPAIKTLEDFNLDHQPSLRRDILAHLTMMSFVAKAENVVLLGPPGVGKTHLGIGLGIAACHAGYPVAFDTATGWAARLAAAHAEGRLEYELKRLRRYKLLIIDEVGYLPFDADQANLFFQLIAHRYEQGSILVTSNMPFGRWGEIFGWRHCGRRDDRPPRASRRGPRTGRRLVSHALPSGAPHNFAQSGRTVETTIKGVNFRTSNRGQISPVVDYDPTCALYGSLR